MSKRYIKYSLLASAMLCLAVGCTKSCGKNNSAPNPNISIALASQMETLDPRYATSAVASRVTKLVYAPLFELGPDASPEPFLAESVTKIDNLNFKILLKPNLTFHDGSKLSAEDVVYTFLELGSPDVASPHAEKFSDFIKNMSVISDREILIELKQVHAPLLTDLCALGIVSKKSCLGRSQACRHENNGSGPYKVKAWDTAKEVLELIPFSAWFEGAPKSPLLLRVVRDENTRMLELIGKKTDLVEGEISPQNMAELKNHKYLQVQEIAGLGYSYLAFNLRGPRDTDTKDSPVYLTRSALSNKKVRQAISHAINFDQIIDKLLLGAAKRVSGLIPNGHWAKDPNLKLPAFDPKIAENLLDEAGFKRVSPKNMRFSLVLSTTPNRLRQSIAQLYADYLGRIGIDANVHVKEWGALYEDMEQGNFDMFSAIWVPVTDPDLYHWVHHTKSIPTAKDDGGNRHAYSNPQVDSLIEQGRASLDLNSRKAIYQQIEKIMLEDLPYIPLWNENRIIVFNKERLHGFEALPSGSLLAIRKAYIKGSLDKH